MGPGYDGMSGYKGVILSRNQADQWVHTLSKHGIEVIPHDSPVDEYANVIEWPFSVKYRTKEIKVLKFLKTRSGERGIIFLSFDPDDFECIDMMISLLRQPVADPDSGTEEHQAGAQ